MAIRKILSLGSEYFLRGIGASPYHEGSGFDVLDSIDIHRSPGLLQTGCSATPVATAAVDRWTQYIVDYGTYSYACGSHDTSASIIPIFTSTRAAGTPLDLSAAGVEIAGATIYNDVLYFMTNVGVLGKGTSLDDNPTWTQSHVTGFGSQTVTPMWEGPDGYLYIGHGNEVGYLTGSAVSAATLTTDLSFNTGEVVGTGISDGFYNVIGTGAAISPVATVAGTSYNSRPKVVFWDTWSPSWNREWRFPEGPIRALVNVPPWIYGFVGNSIYKFSYSSPPQLVLSDSSISNMSCKIRGGGGSVDVFGDTIYWVDQAGNRVWAYGTKDNRLSKALYVPYQIGTGENGYSVKVLGVLSSPEIWVGGGARGASPTYKLYAFSGGNSTGTATTGLIDLKGTYKVVGIKIVTEPLASGDSLAVGVQNAAGTNIINGTYAYRGIGIETSKYIPTVTTAGGKVEADQIIIDLDFTGNVRVKRIDIFGTEVPGTQDSYGGR